MTQSALATISEFMENVTQFASHHGRKSASIQLTVEARDQAWNPRESDGLEPNLQLDELLGEIIEITAFGHERGQCRTVETLKHGAMAAVDHHRVEYLRYWKAAAKASLTTPAS